MKQERFAHTRECPIHPPIKLADEWGAPQLWLIEIL